MHFLLFFSFYKSFSLSWSRSRNWSQSRSQTKSGPGPWYRSRHISGPSLGPGPIILLVPALVLVKLHGPFTQWS